MGCAASFIRARFGAYAYRRQQPIEKQQRMCTMPDDRTIQAAYAAYVTETGPEEVVSKSAFTQLISMTDLVTWTARELLDADVGGQPIHGDGTVIADYSDGFVPAKYLHPVIGAEGEARVAYWAKCPIVPACVVYKNSGGKYTMLDGVHRMLMQLRCSGKFTLCVLEGGLTV